jgi:predicted nucleotidyltransferase
MSGTGRHDRVAGTSPASPHRERARTRQRRRDLGRIGVYAVAEQAS